MRKEETYEEDGQVLLIAIACAWDCSRKVWGDSSIPEPLRIGDRLIPAIEENMAIKITLRERKWDSRSILGSLEVYGSKADVIFATDLKFCWKRFVIAKELAHLLADTSAQKVTTDSQISDLIAWLTIGASGIELNSPIGAEESASLLALGLLLPEDHRSQIEAMFHEKKSYLEIAHCYKVPEAMVRVYFSESYRRLMDEASQCLPKPDLS